MRDAFEVVMCNCMALGHCVEDVDGLLGVTTLYR